MTNRLHLIILTLLSLITASCATVKAYEHPVMTPPAILDDDQYNPFIGAPVLKDRNRLPVLFATNRIPAGEGDKQPHYLDQRTDLIRFGEAGVAISNRNLTWDDMAMIEDYRNRKRDGIMKVTDVEDYGIMDDSATIFSGSEDEIDGYAKERFLIQLRSQLARSETKDVYIFVHGYNVSFENPIMMTAELRHYLGYRGAFMTFGWPATDIGTAYFKDLDTAMMSTRPFRIFLEFLARQPEVEKIHILGYSAGTRLVTSTLSQITLQRCGQSPEEMRSATKLGTVILSNSDMDRSVFGSYLADGQLDILERMTVYTSSKDSVLNSTRTFYFRPRLGQTMSPNLITNEISSFLEQNDRISIVDVSNAENVTAMGGHFYFLESSWVSSDLLLSFITGKGPAQRGLVRNPDQPIWQFPDDYVERTRRLFRGTPVNTGAGYP
ncbi:MAG: alpha/beta hydrolase [Spirochaetales bacterium]|nr:alpha/beta hydrolase [Spirochaetales bacterium]